MSRERAHGDRGAVLAEFALLGFVLVIIAFGIVEFGMGWKDRLGIQTATRSGARAGSGLGDDRLADWSVLQAVGSGLADFPATDIRRISADFPATDIRRIVVYRANTAGDTVPTSCVNASYGATGGGVDTATVKCNVYMAADLSLPQSSFSGTSCSATAKDRFWCPVGREDQQGIGPDYLGLWVEVFHPYFTGLFGDGITIRDSIVMRLEPEVT